MGMKETAEKTIRNAKKVWEEADRKEKSGEMTKKQAKWSKDRAHKAAESARASQGYSGGDDGSERNKTKKRADYTYVDGKSDNKKIVSNTGNYDNKKTGNYDVEKRDNRTNRKTSYDRRGSNDAGKNEVEEVYKNNVTSNENTASDTLRNKINNTNPNSNTKSSGNNNNISTQDQAKIDSFKNGYDNASNVYEDPEKIKKAQDYFHEQSEKIRSKYGFSGGIDGSETNTIDNDQPTNTTSGETSSDSQYDFPESMSEDVKTQIQELGDKWMDIDAKQKAGEISEEEATKLKEEYSSQAEGLRNESGYTGGQDGNNFNKIEGTPEFVANEWVKLDDGGEVMYDEDGNINGYRNQELDPETEAMVNSINAQLEESKSTQEFYENAIDELTKGSETKIDVLSYEEALKQAGDQINPIYEKGMNDFMEQSDKNAVRRGVFNQVPTEAYKNYKAGEIQSEKSAQISSLANKLRGQSVNEANQTKQLNMQEIQNKLNVLMAGLQASGQANSQAMNAMQIINNIRNQSKQNTLNEENTKWQQEFAENQQDFNEETTEWQQNFNKENQDFSQNIQMAQLTGSLNGEDTMAQKQFDFNKDVTSTQLSQTWSKIKNDSTALSQAQERLGLSYDAQEMNEKQFKLTVQDKAYQMTKEGLASDVAEFDPTTYNALAEQDRQTNQPQGLLPGDAGYSTEATNYLDSMMNQKTESISREEFENLYESNLSEINSQLGGLDEYKD